MSPSAGAEAVPVVVSQPGHSSHLVHLQEGGLVVDASGEDSIIFASYEEN